MPTTIKLKNGSGAPTAGDLVQGEPALDLTNKRLYTEDAGGNVIEVGTSPSTIDINAGSIDGVTLGTNSAVTSAVITTADINGGTIDNTTIGGSTPAAGTFTTITGSGLVTAQDGLVVDNDGATVATFDRATSDGDIVEFQKGGTTVGSIGTTLSKLVAGTGDVGLLFDDSAEQSIKPRNTTGASRDAAIDLGKGSHRFKDLFLSGGIYVGGTGAANYLDDYEEGTWTPAASSTGGSITSYTADGLYTKTGNIVHVLAHVQLTNVGTATGGLVVTLPFADDYPSVFHQSTGTVRETNNTGNIFFGRIRVTDTDAQIQDISGGSINWVNNYRYVLTLTYKTSA